MSVRVIHGLDDLARDQRQIATKAPSDLLRLTSRAGRVGASVCRDFTKVSGGSHAGVSGRTGRVQPLVKSITSEVINPGAFGLFAVEIGPDDSMPQSGIMRLLERGSQNNGPKFIMARTADLMGPALAGEVRDQAKRWFE